MRRAVRGDLIIYEESWPVQWFVSAAFLPAIVIACIDPYAVSLTAFVANVVGIVACFALRRRLEIDHARGRLRVAWMLGVTPGLPALTLYTVLDCPTAHVSEVLVDFPFSSRYGRRHPVVLLHDDPRPRHVGSELCRTRLATFLSPEGALAAAGRVAEDLCVPARDVQSS